MLSESGDAVGRHVVTLGKGVRTWYSARTRNTRFLEEHQNLPTYRFVFSRKGPRSYVPASCLCRLRYSRIHADAAGIVGFAESRAYRNAITVPQHRIPPHPVPSALPLHSAPDPGRRRSICGDARCMIGRAPSPMATRRAMNPPSRARRRDRPVASPTHLTLCGAMNPTGAANSGRWPRSSASARGSTPTRPHRHPVAAEPGTGDERSGRGCAPNHGGNNPVWREGTMRRVIRPGSRHPVAFATPRRGHG